MPRHSISTDELIDLITRHQVIEAERLCPYLTDRAGAAGVPRGAGGLVAEMVRDGLLTGYQSEKLLAGEGAGLVLGKYHLIDRLGPPGSSVFLAERRPGRQKFAVKVLNRDPGLPPTVVERFRLEAEALARLDHPGIVGIKDSGEDRGRLFLVTEYIEGESLAELVRQKGPMAPALAVRVIYSALEALAHINEIGLVHRNLEPGHLMVDRDGEVHIVDLGVARFLDDPRAALTMMGGMAPLGAVGFQAPEQIRNSHEVDIRADVYALGATLYYLFTGMAPLDEHAALRLAAGEQPLPEPLAQVRPDLPHVLVTVVERMMAPRRQDRYRTPAEAARALNEWLQEAAPRPLKVPTWRTPVQVPTVRVAAVQQEVPAEPREETVVGGVPPWLVAAVVFVLSAAACLGMLWMKTG